MKRYSRLFKFILLLGFVTAAETASAQDRLSSQTNQWVTAFFHSFNADLMQGDLDAWMDHWADDAERMTPMGNAKGKAAIRELYVRLSQNYEGMVQRVVGTIIEGNNASVELDTRGIHRATGIEVSMPNVAVLTFNEQGKVTSAHVYLDMKNVERQLAR